MPILSQAPDSPVAKFSFAANLSSLRRTLHSRKLMLALSFGIEDIAASVPGTTLIVAFQRLSLARPQMGRYALLTPKLVHTYIVGVPDVTLPELPNTTIVPIEPTWPLMHEWVVLANGPACSAGLFAYDHEISQPNEVSRRFQGAWTTDALITDTVQNLFLRAIGQPLVSRRRDQAALRQTTQRVQQVLTQRLRGTA